jgi:protein-disulfide isomerase
MNAARWKVALDVITSLALVGASAVMVWVVVRQGSVTTPVRRGSVDVPASPLPLQGPRMGEATAPVVLTAFMDFECPYCRHFATAVLPELERGPIASGVLQVVFRHLPLHIHRSALLAANYAACAEAAGKFWQFHAALFGRQALDPSVLEEEAARFGLELCDSADATVRRDGELAASLGLTSTPTFLVGRAHDDGTFKVERVLVGAQSPSQFAEVIEQMSRK